ncbi:cell division protein 48 [Mycobacterium intracellulare MOTT-02]|nr:cell division protein 48 [Mycobacterium intracellulare ATCC 13950]AFC50978.1 cell division protein 48 [Mycobacterium intracellulare MOTT-02]ETZ32213.1 AAA domain family protein [Mycobacterium intracellulare MIN_061107_1834]BCO48970.1 ATPase [Mycobacterium intracellulare]BCP39356.1 ATPase [Mycobacterium intracellulare M.i.198]
MTAGGSGDDAGRSGPLRSGAINPASRQLTLTARLNTSAVDSRRGVIRLHPSAVAALGIREWDAVSLIGSRTTAAVAGLAGPGTPVGTVLLDDVTLSNAGLREGSAVVVGAVTVYGARSVTLSGSTLASQSITPDTLRQALLGKVLMVGDAVSLLPRDLGPGTSSSAATRALATAVGISWTSELLTVTGVDPMGPVSVQPNSLVTWGTGDVASGAATPSRISVEVARPEMVVEELKGTQPQAAKLVEWLKLALDEPHLLKTLGAGTNLGVLVSGPAGVGKVTLVRAVCGDRRLVTLDGPEVGALAAEDRLKAVASAVQTVRDGGGVLLITDVDALLPAAADPVASLILGELRTAVASDGVALIATSARPDQLDARLRAPDLCDRELGLPLPDAATRKALLESLLKNVPAGGLDLDEIASRTPGFVVADLAALVREAALRAASRASADGRPPELNQEDLVGALSVIRPLSRSASEEVSVGDITLEDVGDMAEARQALTEAVLWPLQHPDTFARLGVDPPRGVLLYGPPGCGKTFVVRALASTGQLSVHAVKGSELMDKWVGSSEKAVRELFRRARDSAPSLVFLDEVDALAPRRGQSFDSGVTDRVVAALLTELDGVDPLRDVVVLGATNRPDLIDPALLRPGRLERLVFVEPPDAAARRDILRTAGKSVPLSADVDLDEVAARLDGYSAADCVALLREAALTAMRRSLDATDVTAADLAAARETVRPSLDPAQVESLRAFAKAV